MPRPSLDHSPDPVPVLPRLPTSPEIGRIIVDHSSVAEGAAWLASHDARFAMALEICAPLPLRRRADGFGALADIIIGQQVSVASARALTRRMEAARLTTADAIREATDAQLREAGMSRQKVRYLRALAEADLDYAALRELPDAEVVAHLTQLPGIGPWTAEIYAMFALGRADMFAPGDLALQEAARLLFELPERPDRRALLAIAAPWSPWRAVAARLLWAYYKVVKEREGVA